MAMLYLSYLDLSPELNNTFARETHQVVINLLRREFDSWDGFSTKYDGFDLGFIVVTKKGISKLEVHGPSISKKSKLVDYSIFLPEILSDLLQYIDLIFEGFNQVVSNFGVDGDSIMSLKNQCKDELAPKNNEN